MFDEETFNEEVRRLSLSIDRDKADDNAKKEASRQRKISVQNQPEETSKKPKPKDNGPPKENPTPARSPQQKLHPQPNQYQNRLPELSPNSSPQRRLSQPMMINYPQPVSEKKDKTDDDNDRGLYKRRHSNVQDKEKEETHRRHGEREGQSGHRRRHSEAGREKGGRHHEENGRRHSHSERHHRHPDDEEDSRDIIERLEKKRGEPLTPSVLDILQSLQDEHISSEQKLLMVSDEFDRMKSEKAALQASHKKQVEEMMADNKKLTEEMRSLEDTNTLLRLENEEIHHHCAQLQKQRTMTVGTVHCDMKKLEDQVAAYQQEIKVLRTEMDCCQKQLQAKEKSFKEAVALLKKHGVQDEAESITQKTEKEQANFQVEDVKAELLKVLDELHKVRFDKELVDEELFRVSQNLQVQRQLSTDLKTQCSQLANNLDLQQKSVCELSTDDIQRRAAVQSLTNSLEKCNRDKAVYFEKIKTQEELIKYEQGRMSKLEAELAGTDQTIITRLDNLSESQSTDTELAYKSRLLQIECDRLKDELTLSRARIDRMLGENTAMTSEVWKQRQIIESQEAQLEALALERKRLMKETQGMEEEIYHWQSQQQGLKGDLSKHYTDIQQISQQLQGDLTKLTKTPPQPHGDKTKVSVEIDKLKRMMDARNTEIAILQDTNSQLQNENECLQKRLSAYGTSKEDALHVVEQHRRTIKNLEKQLSEEMRQNAALLQELASYKASSESSVDTMKAANQQAHNVKQDLVGLQQQVVEEQGNCRKLKVHLNASEAKCEALQTELEDVWKEVSKLKHDENQNIMTISQLNQENKTMYQDIQDLCSKLSCRDYTIEELQQRLNCTVEKLQQDLSKEKKELMQQNLTTESALLQVKEELVQLEEEVRRKEQRAVQLQKTIKELTDEKKKEVELESELKHLEQKLHKAQVNNSRLEKENQKLDQLNHELQVSVTKLRDNSRSVNEQVAQVESRYNDKLKDLEKILSKEQMDRSNEKIKLERRITELQDEIGRNRTLVAETQELKLQASSNIKSTELTIETLRSTLNQETSQRQQAEQRLNSLHQQYLDLQEKRVISESRESEIQRQYSQLTSEYSSCKERCKQLQQQLAVEHDKTMDKEGLVGSYQMETGEARAEVLSLKTEVEMLTGHNQKLALKLQQCTDTHEREQLKLTSEVQQLNKDLERARTQLSDKNRECVQEKENMLTLEAKVNDLNRELRSCMDRQKGEEALREKLEERNLVLENLVTKTREAPPATIADKTKNEVHQLVTDLSRRVQEQLDRSSARGDSQQENVALKQKIEILQAKLCNVECCLSQEQALHVVTKTQLQSAEDEVHRLQQQMSLLRRRMIDTTHASNSRTRLEEINEIIAKSQARAQQMIASGQYQSQLDPYREHTYTRHTTAYRDPIYGKYQQQPDPVESKISKSSRKRQKYNTNGETLTGASLVEQRLADQDNPNLSDSEVTVEL